VPNPNYASLLAQIAAETDPTTKQNLIDQCYQFVEPLTEDEQELFEYVEFGYIDGNPGIPVAKQMTTPFEKEVAAIGVFGILESYKPELTPFASFVGATANNSNIEPNYVPQTHSVVGNRSGSWWLWSDTASSTEGTTNAVAGAKITFSSGSSKLVGTITGFYQIGRNQLHYVDFDEANSTGLDYFTGLSNESANNRTQTYTVRIESPDPTSYVGVYYNIDGIIQ
jgi:hypothetical protein